MFADDRLSRGLLMLLCGTEKQPALYKVVFGSVGATCIQYRHIVYISGYIIVHVYSIDI